MILELPFFNPSCNRFFLSREDTHISAFKTLKLPEWHLSATEECVKLQKPILFDDLVFLFCGVTHSTLAAAGLFKCL